MNWRHQLLETAPTKINFFAAPDMLALFEEMARAAMPLKVYNTPLRWTLNLFWKPSGIPAVCRNVL